MTRSTTAVLFLLLCSFPAHAVLTVMSNFLVHETCTYANGSVYVYGLGGVEPYSYSWADGPTVQSRGGLSAGSYTVTVTDANSDQASLTVDIFSYPYQFEGILNGMPWCTAPGNAFIDPMVSGAANNWTVNGQIAEEHGTGNFQFVAEPGSFTYPVDDGNGCTGTVTGTSGPQITSFPELTVTSVEPSCTGQNLGAIHITSAEPQPPGAYGPYVNLIRDDGDPQFQAYSLDVDQNVHFGNLAPGYYGVHWWLGTTAEGADPGICNYDTLWVTVPSLGATCGSVGGISYFDVDGDCAQDANETGIPYSTLLVQPGNELAVTNALGHYNFPLFNGNYTVEQTDPTLVPSCPLPQPIAFTVNSDLTTIDLANGSTQQLDLRAGIGGGLFRPGFTASYHLWVRNLSPQQSGPVTIVVELDVVLDYLYGDVVPTSVNVNTLTWELPAFNSYEQFEAHITVQVPVGTSLGTQLITTASASNTLPDANAANDTGTAADVVIGSFDSNEKRSETSTRASGSLYFIDEDEWIDYTIRFQNTGTFLAEFVVITDTVASELDLATFEHIGTSHPFTLSFKPGRVIEWRFDDINLPDSASDELGSHGLVNFRIRPYPPLSPGTILTNTANIFFDYNEPVITEPSVLTAEFSTSTGGSSTSGNGISLYPNPANDVLSILSRDHAIKQLRILGADGRILREIVGSDPLVVLDIHDLPAGVYAVDVHLSGDDLPMHLRFVKH